MNKKCLLIVMAVLFTFGYAIAQVPKVSHIYPDAGINTQSLDARIYGANFQTDLVNAVKLVRPGYPDIDGTSISVATEEYLTCSFDMTGDSTGLYDLVVSNSSGEDTLLRCFTVYTPSGSPLVWTRTVIDSGAPASGYIAVGDADGDHEIELYGAKGWSIYQYKWDGMGWSKTAIGAGSNYFIDIALGDVDRDGKIEIYVACLDETLYVFEWNGLSWDRTPFWASGGGIRGVTIGDADGDGENELYIAARDSIFEFEWDGVIWQWSTVGACSLSTLGFRTALAVGDGNDDGEIELYGCAVDSTIQFKWDGVSWVESAVSRHTDYAVALGDGNRDGDMETYAGGDSILQFKWNGVNWTKTPMGRVGFGAVRIAVADCNGDAEIEVYATSGIEPGFSVIHELCQYEWTGASWTETTLYSIVGVGIPGLAVGDGNYDGEMEVYVATNNGDLYQFKAASIPDIELAETSHDFGPVPVGDSLDWEYLIIRNVGVDTLFIDSLLSDTAVYSVAEPTFPDTILSDDSTLVTIRFKPVAPDTISGTLRVYSNDPDEAVLNVSLTGVGIIPPKVSHIYPDAGINTVTIDARIYGADFQTDPVNGVKLVRPGNPDIDGTSINVVSEEYLTCSFNLTGSSTGLYDLVVSNSFGNDTLPGCFTICSPSVSPYIWERTTVSPGGISIPGLIVGDADNDGEIEIYRATGSSLFRFEWDGFMWLMTFLGGDASGMFDIVLGDGNGDDELEVYGACYDDSVYQFKWNGFDFTKTAVGAVDSSIRSLAMGDGNLDGELEIYASDPDSIYQFKWDGIGWIRTTVGACSLASVWLRRVLVAGDGNDDGEIELYTYSSDSIYQFKWNGISWTESAIAEYVGFALAVGDGDQDGETEIYAGGGSIHQFKWNGTSWGETIIGGINGAVSGLIVGDGNGDAGMEVYATGGIDLGIPPEMGLYQFAWNGAQWERTTIYWEELYEPVLGDGNSDGEMEVYCVRNNGEVNQYKPAFIPDIELAETSHDFGSVPIGDSLDWGHLVIRNVGVDTLFIDSILSDTVVYVVAKPTFPDTILSDDSTLVTIRFKPLAPDTVSGTLKVYSNDPDEPVLNISLTGVGIGSTPPDSFNLISPPDSAVLAITRPTFVWGASDDTLEGLRDYHVYIDFTLRDSTVDTSWASDFDLAEAWHDWYIVAYDSAGNPRQSSETWALLIDTTAPSIVTLISPTDNSYLNDTTVNFMWHQSTDSLSGIDHYILQHTLDSSFSSGVTETTSVDTVFTHSLSDSVYYWRARAVDKATNQGNWSDVWNFTIDTEIPDAPALISPTNGIFLSDTLVIFEWSEVTSLALSTAHDRDKNRGSSPLILESAIKYVLQVDTLLDFVSPLLVDTLDTTSTALFLFEDFPFCWRVRAYDLTGNESPYADPDSFGIDITPPVVESTTVLVDTSFVGPFEILTKASDNLAGVDSVVLCYKRDEDPDWVSVVMSPAGAPDWYVDSIPAVSNVNDTVRYYVGAFDAAQPPNSATDPEGAPAEYHMFIGNFVGVAEAKHLPRDFSFGHERNPARNRVSFHLAIPEPAIIILKVYDVSGRLIDTPMRGAKPAGLFDLTWGSGISSGVYFYCLESPWGKRTGKLVLIR